MGIRVTDRFWPVMVLEVHGTLTPEDVEQMDVVYREAFARPGRFVAWSDMRGLRAVPGPTERRRVAEWLRRIEPEMKANCLGSCNLVSSPIIRGVMTALYWIFTPPVPQAFVAVESDALEWCRERLREAGDSPDATLDELSRWLRPMPSGSDVA